MLFWARELLDLKKMKRPKKNLIGIFGGSFDPVHAGHIKISLESIKRLKLKTLYFLITNRNPFKKKPFFNIDIRIKKSKKLLKKNKKIKVRSLDKFISSNRTIDVIKYLIKKNKKSRFYLIIGSDTLIMFHKWKSWKKILKLCKLVVFSRYGFDLMANKSKTVKYLDKKNIIFVKDKKIKISSSKLRKNYLV